MPRDERMTLRESRVPIAFQYPQRSALTVSLAPGRDSRAPSTDPVAKSHEENRRTERHGLVRARRSLVDGAAAEGMPRKRRPRDEMSFPGDLVRYLFGHLRASPAPSPLTDIFAVLVPETIFREMPDIM